MKNKLNAIPERFVIASEILASESNYNILEIGCGTGILAGKLADSLQSGKVTALDRSGAMISQAIKNNEEKISGGRIEFIQGDFLNTDLPANHFHRIIAFNVNFFRKNCSREFLKIKNLLTTTGVLLICYQAPRPIALNDSDPVKSFVGKYGFKVKSLILYPLAPFPAWYLLAEVV